MLVVAKPLRGKRTATRDDTDIAFLVNVPGRDADAAAAGGLITLPGHDVGTIRVDKLGVTGLKPFYAQHVHRNTLMATTSSSPASLLRGWRRRRTVRQRRRHRVAPVSATASATLS